jgi:hypothetical protein
MVYSILDMKNIPEEQEQIPGEETVKNTLSLQGSGRQCVVAGREENTQK